MSFQRAVTNGFMRAAPTLSRIAKVSNGVAEAAKFLPIPGGSAIQAANKAIQGLNAVARAAAK
jgi:hypothetical protein